MVLILLLGGLAYSNTFQVPFVFDDISVIVENRNLDSFSSFFASSDFSSARWLPLATFALNKSLGGLNLAGFHVVNLSIHIATGLVLYLLAKITLATFGEAYSRRYAFAPLMGGLTFVLHPLHTQSVTYIVQRMTSLATLLYLFAILFYAQAFAGRAEGGGPSRSAGGRHYAAAIISCLLALGSKEICYTLPVALALYDLCFLKGTTRERLLRLAPFFMCQAIMFFSLVGMDRVVDAQAHGGGAAINQPLPWETYLITQLSVLCTYLRLLVLPAGQNLDYDFPKFQSLFHPQAALSFALIAALIWSGVSILKKSFDQGCDHTPLYRVSGFAIVWFFITISIESGLVPLLDIIVEHRVYLPSVWLFIALGTGSCELYHRLPTGRLHIVLGVVALVLILGTATYRRNQVWGDALVLWTDVTEKSPGRARGWTNLGMHYVKRLDPLRAIPHLEHAVRLNPNYYPARYWLGRALVQNGDSEGALGHYLVLTELAPDYPKGWEAVGRILLEKGLASEAIFYFNRSLELDPGGFASHAHLQTALSIDTQQQRAHNSRR